jgi:sulfoxide reductase heme-binding subunit YedZ
VVGVVNTEALWYLTRGTGLVSIALLTVTTVLGILQVQRWQSEGWPRFVVAAVHKNASLLVVAFLAVHIAVAIIDGFAPIRWLDAVVPFQSAYRPIWLGLGALAFDLLIALVITSLLRQRLGYGAWRVVHWTAYACWPVAFVHGLGTGTDITRSWVLLLYGACLISVLAALVWRISSAHVDPGTRTAGTAATVFVTLLILGFVVLGPAKDGWARRAGTPAELLGGSSATTGLALPFDASMSGTVDESLASSGRSETVTIDATLDDADASVLHISLQGTPVSSGGIQMASSNVTFGSSSAPQEYNGQITKLQGSEVIADVANADGTAIRLDVKMTINDNRVTGTVAAGAGGN